jgi:hypothetical protein
MSQRKIEVNGKPFQYSIGRTHVKIRGEGYSKLFTKAEIGQPIAYRDDHVVTPANIRNAILGRPGPRVFVCAEHLHVTTALNFDPYAEEIYRKNVLMPDCPRCLDELGWDI